MKRLVLMRHGHAPGALAAGVDCDALRPLSAQGVDEVRQSALKLKACGVGFGLILASPLLRAAQTAAAVSEVLRVRVSTLQELDGNCGPALVWKALLPVLKEQEAVIVVGHQPIMGLLAGALLKKTPLPFATADFALLALGERFNPDDGAVAESTLELSSD